MRRGIVFLVLFSITTTVTSYAISAQILTGPQGQVVIAKLSAPVYPQIVRVAHVFGEVHLTVYMRQDGGIESAVVTSGPPLLRLAALNSAQGSQFECRGCSEVVTEYSLVYAFQLGPDPGCKITKKTPQTVEKEQSYPRVIQSENHLRVIDRPVELCDPLAEIGRVRSAKCLFLWRCGYRHF